MDMRSMLGMPADQVADQLMKAYPQINPSVFAAQAQNPGPGPQTMGPPVAPAPQTPWSGTAPVPGAPTPPGAAPAAAGNPMAMMGAVMPMMQPKPAAPSPMMALGRGGAPANPGSYPIAAPTRARSQSLGDILGGLK